jgi:hypothetical protein
MKLKDVFDQLTHGELGQLSIGGAKAGFIEDTNYDAMLCHVNMGLTALHRRFALKEGTLLLKFIPGVYRYKLQSTYALSTEELVLGAFPLMLNGVPLITDFATLQDYQYIQDSPTDSFEDNILKVERVIATDTGKELPLNDLGNEYSVRTPQVDHLLVPKLIVDQGADLPLAYRTQTLDVVFRANHVKIQPGAGMYDANRVEVDLPEAYLDALCYFIASRLYNPIGMVNEFHAGNSFAAKFEMICQQLKDANLEIDQGSSSDRFEARGFV